MHIDRVGRALFMRIAILLVAEGYTTMEIAKKLFISEARVNSHRRNLDKINAKNTASLIKFALDNKLV